MSKLMVMALVVAYFVALGYHRGDPIVRDMGFCPDVSSPTCIVRAYWPVGRAAESVGQEVYWLLATDGRVCFITRQEYTRAIVGHPFNCLWRERHL